MPFLEEVTNVLEAAGVGVSNTNIFHGTKVQIPVGDGPYLQIRETGGTTPLRIQNSIAPQYQRPAAQLVAIALDYVVARLMARAAYNALAVVRNTSILGTRYLEINVVQEPFDLTLDAAGRVRIAFNITALKGPS